MLDSVKQGKSVHFGAVQCSTVLSSAVHYSCCAVQQGALKCTIARPDPAIIINLPLPPCHKIPTAQRYLDSFSIICFANLQKLFFYKKQNASVQLPCLYLADFLLGAHDLEEHKQLLELLWVEVGLQLLQALVEGGGEGGQGSARLLAGTTLEQTRFAFFMDVQDLVVVSL